MLYYFNDFVFDSQSLVLMQGKTSVAIRHNEAQVLKVLLEHSAMVVSKELLLKLVWQNKIVSEQAIFQNISHLRALFGNDAIKTFAKRGYQWQLAFEIGQQVVIPTTVHVAKKTPRTSLWVASAFTFLLIVGLFIGLTSNEQSTFPSISTIQFALDGNDDTSVAWRPATISTQPIESLSASQFQGAEALNYKKLKTEHPLILMGDITTSDSQYLLDFTLTGGASTWNGQLLGRSIEQLNAQLEAHLTKTEIIELVNSPMSADIRVAKLLLLHQQHEHDLVVLNQLVSAYVNTKQLDIAMTLADKLERLALALNEPQQNASALLLQSAILTEKGLYELSEYKLTRAIDLFKKHNDYKRLADAYAAQSWLLHKKQDYTALKDSLLKSARFAQTSKDIERELHALTYLSVMAHKHHQDEDAYFYLQQAKAQMDTYALPQYQYAKIPFHYAIYAQTEAQKEPHLLRVLELTELTPDHWVAQSSRKQLMDYYLETTRFDKAEQLVASLANDNAENNLLRARLAFSKSNVREFSTLATKAFEQARRTGQVSLSLDIALLLCSAPELQTNYDFYTNYISEHATPNWSEQNKLKLNALNMI
ncbi:winged helix-turn-helix domain-containing protein [Pseudoalteromonas xiamenensis]